jgi:hypothetical protein
VATTDDQPEDMTQWKARAEIRAPELWEGRLANGHELSKQSFIGELLKDLRNDDFAARLSINNSLTITGSR